MDFGSTERFVSDGESDLFHDVTKYLISAGYLVFFTISIALLLFFDHLFNWEKPREQKKIIPIIFIPSIHSIASFAASIYKEDSKMLVIVLDAVKECSVGLGLAMLLSLLYIYMDINTTEHSETDIRIKVGGRVICNVFPMTLFQPRYVHLNKNNLKFHKYWTWQFVAIRLVCSVFMIVLQLLDMYPVWLSWAFFSLLNFSVSLAFFNLAAFYQAFNEDFTVREETKLLLFKGFVFVCFVQGGVLKVIGAMGIIKANQVHNFLVVMEMKFLSLFLGHATRLSYLHIGSTKFAVPKSALAEANTVACAA